MATTVYGSKVNSVWRCYMTYSVTTNDTQVVVSISSGLNIPNKGYSTERAFTGHIYGSGQATATGTISATKRVGVGSWGIVSKQYVFTRGASNATYTISADIVSKDLKSSCSATITVPKLDRPRVTVSASRDTANVNRITVKAVISSFNGDEITGSTLTVGGESIEGGIGTGTVSGSTLTLEKTVVKSVKGAIPIGVTATGNNGTSEVATYNLPAIGVPSFSLVATRSKTVRDEITVTATISSWALDVITSTLMVGASVVSGGVGQGTIPSDGSPLVLSKTITGVTTLSVDVRVTVTGDGGTSKEVIAVVPVAFTTASYKAGGKAIAFGQDAVDDASKPNGLFTCSMDAQFNGETNFQEGITTEGTLFQNNNKVLWQGAWYMNGDQTAILSERISEQSNGIVLVFSAYTDETAKNWGFSFHFIPKWFVAALSGSGVDINLVRESHQYSATKYLYFADDRIVGHANNNKTGTGTDGVKYTNNYFVLRYVIGV